MPKPQWPRIVRLGAGALSVVAQGEALDSALLIGNVEVRDPAGQKVLNAVITMWLSSRRCGRA